jgi:NADH-quinone oxidoreductase subunit J
MEFKTFVFYFLATVLVYASLRVVTLRNPVHAALHLVLAFFSASGVWILLQAEFLAIVLVLVYVGAVMVLFLFVVMMLDINIEQLREGFARNAPLGVLIAFIMIVELVYVLWVRRLGIDLPGTVSPVAEGQSNTAEIGAVLYTQYVYPFQLAAIVLLIAIVAAITLTMRRRPGLKVQDISSQVAVRAADRVRLVDIPTEREP